MGAGGIVFAVASIVALAWLGWAAAGAIAKAARPDSERAWEAAAQQGDARLSQVMTEQPEHGRNVIHGGVDNPTPCREDHHV